MGSQAEATSPSWRAATAAWDQVRRSAGALRRGGLELAGEQLMAEAAEALVRVLENRGIRVGGR